MTPCQEKYHRAWSSLRQKMSEILPFKGGLTPLHSNLEPITPDVV